ncbi:MAG TPA: aminotransferase class I/II-fold pyridoxal phosphate-dependent enzyme [Vicinamibacterales bacterium]|nr:aminotransferase class I/II-fold pyridoxal phosphate-dependent enzyme [Vicinamibacterales bacterium]
MLSAIPRYGARIAPGTDRIVAECRRRGELVDGPHIERFERAFAGRLGLPYAVATAYGRMAFYYLLKAFDLPPGAEIVFPAVTFWAVPEIARAAGLKPVFADVQRRTFTLDPQAFAAAISRRTCAVVPTHLYGLPCDMDRIVGVARRHGLIVIEDCAHALGATYRGRPVGTLGDAAFFSFQFLKPLNTYGGGMAVTRDAAIAARVASMVGAERRPDPHEVLRRLWIGRLQRLFVRPAVFTATGFPVLLAASLARKKPDVYLWEPIRRLDPLPPAYRTGYSNVQAAIGLAALDRLDAWTAATVRHAQRVSAALADLDGIELPVVPPDRTHVFYQFCVTTPWRDEIVARSIRRGLDVDTLHVDICPELPLFESARVDAPGARHAAHAVQVPVHASLTEEQVTSVIGRLRQALAPLVSAARLAEAMPP